MRIEMRFCHAEARRSRRTSLEAMSLADDSVFKEDRVAVDQHATPVNQRTRVASLCALIHPHDLRLDLGHGEKVDPIIHAEDDAWLRVPSGSA